MSFDIFLFPIKSAFMFAGMLLGVLLFLFWIWMIIDCAKRNFKNNIEKVAWIIVIILATWLGALIYFLVVLLSNPRGIFRR